MSDVVERIEAYCTSGAPDAPTIAGVILDNLRGVSTTLATLAEAIGLLNELDTARGEMLAALAVRLDALESAKGPQSHPA